MNKGINGWQAKILKIFMKFAWLIIKFLQIIGKLIDSIFSKK